MKSLAHKLYNKIYDGFMDKLALIHWKPLRKKLFGYSNTLDTLSEKEINKIKLALSKGYYIILTEDRAHLSSWAVKLGHFMITGKFGTYTHALVNVEAETARIFKFVEAVNKGVKVSTFEEIMACDSICILKPKWYTQAEFDRLVGTVYANIGKAYDKKFNYKDSLEMSCVEIARDRLRGNTPESIALYEERMRVFDYMITREGNLTPQMFRDCEDFSVVLEIRR